MLIVTGSVLLGLTLVMLLAYSWELVRHNRNLNRIPIRIHVNGTRGKSSLTRLISAGFRSAGIATVSKTTGTLAQMTLPNGQRIPIMRASKPNIIEQVRVVRRAAQMGARALIIECMALEPQLQELCESKLIRSTHGVLTNVRADHLEIMGPKERDVAHALCATIPREGVLFTAEREHLDLFDDVARSRQTQVIAPCRDRDGVSSEVLAKFDYIEHGENLSLALAVCRHFGIERERALDAMMQSGSDVGALRFFRLREGDRHVIFANAFAANDPQSTRAIWDVARNRHPDVASKVVLVNCRADRSARSQQLAQALLQWPDIDRYLVVGQQAKLFVKLCRSSGVAQSKLTLADEWSAQELVTKLAAFSATSSLVVGVGNIAGIGLELLDIFETTWDTI